MMVLGEIGRMRTGEVALGDIKLFGLCRALSISLQMISTALISPGSPLFAIPTSHTAPTSEEPWNPERRRQILASYWPSPICHYICDGLTGAS